MTFSGKRKSVSSKTKPLCQGLPCQGSWRRRRLRGWTKDSFRVSGERRCCSVQPLRHLRFARCHLPCQERLWRAVTFSMISQPLHLVSSETNPPCQGLPCQGSWRRRRLRGWTKDAFRLSGERRCCSVQPLRHGFAVPPPLVGEALAFRDVFQQTSINLSKTTPLCQGLPY